VSSPRYARPDSTMNLLITGATGFVMSVLARHWLEAEPRAHLVILDVAATDAAAARYFAPVADRLSVVVADITKPETWREALAPHNITHIVHGATITPISRGTAHEARTEPEADNPAHIVDVNLMGTVALLDWALSLPARLRSVGIKSGIPAVSPCRH
jgi:UDP-glucose 4-epimerase